jgi:hypothetical protein
MKIRIDYLLLRLILGRRYREKTWANKRDILELQNSTLISSTPVLADVWSLEPVKYHIDSVYPCFNPSIVSTNSGYKLISRSSNLINLNDGNYVRKGSPHETINYLVDLDHDLNVIGQCRLDDSLIRQPGAVAEFGIEDCRLFRWNQSIWLCGAANHPLSKNRLGVKQVLCKLESNSIVEAKTIDSPHSRPVEKNWAPIPLDDELVLAYRLSPIEIVRVKGSTITYDRTQDKIDNDFILRGGTPFIKWRNIFLGVAHSQRIRYQGKLYYMHYFICLNDELELLETSQPFFIQRKGIEFATGIEITNNGILLSYGVADRAGRLIRIPDSIIEKYVTI